jgi:plasmid stabilization system protein ParE
LKILFTPSGRAQFLSAVAYIHRENPSAAAAFRDKAAASLARLRKFPESGRVLPEFPDLPFREVIVPPYRFFYRIKDKTVWIVSCYHSAQIPGSPGKH